MTDDAGNTIFSHSVEAGDIWRMCQTKDAAIKVTQSNKDEIIYYTFRVLVISQCCESGMIYSGSGYDSKFRFRSLSMGKNCL